MAVAPDNPIRLSSDPSLDLRTSGSRRTKADLSGSTKGSEDSDVDFFDGSASEDSAKTEDENKELEKGGAAAQIRSMIKSALQLLFGIGDIMRANINSNPGMQFTKHDAAVGKAAQAKDLSDRASQLAVVSEVKNVQSEATSTSNLAAVLMGNAKTGAELWRGMIVADRESNKNVQKNADRG